MLALCQKRRRQEDEEDAKRRQRYWDWRAVDPNDYNPVYPFLPPPTPGTDVIIPTPMPPFFSDIDFYLSNRTVLNIRTSAPIIHTINGLALKLGTGLTLQDGALAVTGGGTGAADYNGSAPIQVDNATRTISLNYGSGLQVLNGQLQTRAYVAAAPLGITGNIIYANLGSGFKANNQQGVDVFLGTGLKFSAAGAIELSNPPAAELTATAPLAITDGSINFGYDTNYFELDNATQKLKLNLSDPLEVTGPTGLGLKVGANVRVNDAGQLQVDLPSYAAPLTLTGTEPSRTLTLSTQPPFKVTGNALTLDYESPLTITEDKLSLTVEDPLSLGTNGLELRLGNGLQKDSSGALEITAVTQNLTAESPLHIANDTISLHTDAAFLVDNTTHSLKLNVAEPLQVLENTGLGLNYDPRTFKLDPDTNMLKLNLVMGQSPIWVNENGIQFTVKSGLYMAETGTLNVALDGGGPLVFTDGNNGAVPSIKLNFSNGLKKENTFLTLNCQDPMTTATSTGALGLLLGEGLTVANRKLSYNLQAPLKTDANKLTVDYSSPLTVIDEATLSVTVEEPLMIGTNAIELMLAPSMTKSASGALALKSSDTLEAAENTAAEVKCVQPLQRTATGVSLNFDTNTLELDTTNKLKVKAVPVNLNAVGPLTFTANTGELKLGFNPYQFQAEYAGSSLAILCPTYVYQTPPTQPMRLRNSTYSEYGSAEIWIVRQGMMVTFNMNIIGETTSTGTQTWTIQFDGLLGSCLTGTMKVLSGQDKEDVYNYPTWILPLESIYNTQRAQGFVPIVCSENGVYKQSTYCSWRLYTVANTSGYNNFCIELKSTTSGCKPIFSVSFTYEGGIAIL